MPSSVELPPRSGIAGVIAVLLLDRLLALLPARPLAGVADEAAHLATGALVLAAWPAPEPEFACGLAAGSVLIDVDHVPELWGRAEWLRPRGLRPLPHTLLTPALVSRLPGRAGRGAAVGLVAHLVRDLATGRTRVALLWPLTRRPFSIRYRTYVAVLAALAGIAAARRQPAPSPPHAATAPPPGAPASGPVAPPSGSIPPP